ncbi:unnamed protein product [Vitrella brassicaformis CCMP3155]|uniref:Uncharacterized protein n=2 Tax=Vitrella brassicaformis TaxID=1169539 RepID=A0A0G4FUV2_VITBC|nr:unnamed protein product [Vitrella brassicaformis CCMP3155]|eukprot:CEM18668.1 unnamed protein product [Vitrella brassicaformis CCMP3155]
MRVFPAVVGLALLGHGISGFQLPEAAWASRMSRIHTLPEGKTTQHAQSVAERPTVYSMRTHKPIGVFDGHHVYPAAADADGHIGGFDVSVHGDRHRIQAADWHHIKFFPGAAFDVWDAQGFNRLPSGVRYKTIHEGHGGKPTDDDQVLYNHYEWETGFDEGHQSYRWSYIRHDLRDFKDWIKDAFADMRRGERRQYVVPPSATITHTQIFADIELLDYYSLSSIRACGCGGGCDDC